jgi:hypothetical protein
VKPSDRLRQFFAEFGFGFEKEKGEAFRALFADPGKTLEFLHETG